MKCDACKKDFEKLVPVLKYFANGKPVFSRKCIKCEKEYWMKMKEYFLSVK